MRLWLIVGSILGSYSCSSDDKAASSDKLVLNGAATGSGDATSEAGDTKSLSVAVFGLYASPNQDCSNAIKIFENEEGEYMDFLSEPKLGEGDIAAGEYPCVMIGMMDILSLYRAPMPLMFAQKDRNMKWMFAEKVVFHRPQLAIEQNVTVKLTRSGCM